MPSYKRDCRVCREPIIMAQRSHWFVALEPDGSGVHKCTKTASTIVAAPNHGLTVTAFSRPLTYLTKCFFGCGRRVYFHTNGNGDAVLFDELRKPWKEHVHSCWEEHCKQRHQPLININAILHDEGFIEAVGGRIRRTSIANEITRPAKRANGLVSVVGLVAHNHAINSNEDQTDVSVDAATNLIWTRLDVQANDGLLYPFMLPRSLAEGIADHAIVHLRGEWIRRNGEFLLITKRMSVEMLSATAMNATSTRIAAFGRCHKCFYCGGKIDRDWGFDKCNRLECAGCIKMHGSLSPRQFLRRCRQVANHHK